MYSKRKLVGKILDDNRPPDNIKDVKVLFRGLYKNKVCQFGISNEIMSKHTLILGGTGSGKTNLFYHIVSQLKRNLCSDDVLIIFDSKGDFFDKFYENIENEICTYYKDEDLSKHIINKIKEIYSEEIG